MIRIVSFSVGTGDMFYIKHGSDNFTIIDCCMTEDNRETIVEEILDQSINKSIRRFISTHPDDDHIKGLKYLYDKLYIPNFYCVKNQAIKVDETEDFIKYCELRDSNKAFYLEKGCDRKWLNKDDEDRRSSGISILWPVTNNKDYIQALKNVALEGSPNNISPIIKYSLKSGITMLWMGDLELDFMKRIINIIDMPPVDILFAPHHGRDTGKVPDEWLDQMDPKIIIIGEAPSTHLNYYSGYNTITQNSAGHICFECEGRKVHICVSNRDYSVDFLDKEFLGVDYYLGTLNL